MSQDPEFAPTLVDDIINYLKAGVPRGYFLAFFYGDPLDIPISYMPCIAVELLREQIIQGPTGQDKIISTVQVKLIYNKRDDFGKTPDEVLGVRKLEQFAKGIDPVTLEYDTRTIASILRKNFTLGQLITNEDMIVNYGIVQRPNDELTAECRISVAIEQYIMVTGRQ